MGLIGPKRRTASLAVTGFSPRIHSLRVNRNCVTSGWGTALSLQRLLHRAQALLDHRRDGAGDLAGQQVGDPDDAAARSPSSKTCIDALWWVNRGEPTTAGIDDEPRCQALVHRADVTHGVPDALRGRLDHDLLADGCHEVLLGHPVETPDTRVRETRRSDRAQWKWTPPSMLSTWPVTLSARQNATTWAATSPMAVERWSTARRRVLSTTSAGSRFAMRVPSIRPGATQFTVTSGASATARHRVR